ncbi:unnamed protein product [Soboliphyme baturini]|uniref:HTH CENPB-type domain-containing protein n=1 Tax=Soboliphyme baturini TaxID=241478 RepID=A0A183I8Z8_9BILA|nr:unnamed protein product [Soboliphyme baturini]
MGRTPTTVPRRTRRKYSLGLLKQITEMGRGSKLTVKEISEKTGVCRAVVGRLKKSGFVDLDPLGKFSLGQFRRRAAKYETVEAKLEAWFQTTRSQNLPVSGPLVQAKAKQIARDLGIDDFKGSNGWLHRFKRRLEAMHDADRRAEDEAVERTLHWQTNVLRTVFDEYTLEDIFVCESTVLLYRCFPGEVAKYYHRIEAHTVQSKDRLSLLLTANIMGIYYEFALVCIYVCVVFICFLFNGYT